MTLEQIMNELEMLMQDLVYGRVEYMLDFMGAGVGLGPPQEALDMVVSPIREKMMFGRAVQAEELQELHESLLQIRAGYYLAELTPIIKDLEQLLAQQG